MLRARGGEDNNVSAGFYDPVAFLTPCARALFLNLRITDVQGQATFCWGLLAAPRISDHRMPVAPISPELWKSKMSPESKYLPRGKITSSGDTALDPHRFPGASFQRFPFQLGTPSLLTALTPAMLFHARQTDLLSQHLLQPLFHRSQAHVSIITCQHSKNMSIYTLLPGLTFVCQSIRLTTCGLIVEVL